MPSDVVERISIREIAVLFETLPLARGRFLFVGWALSSLISKRSLKMYMLLAKRLKSKKATSTFRLSWLSLNENEKSRGRNIKRFFIY
jgi:hypothetical protein